jgi:hypothetical protein
MEIGIGVVGVVVWDELEGTGGTGATGLELG